MSEKYNKCETFLNGLKEIGRTKSERKKVQSKIQSYTGRLYRYRPLQDDDQLKWRVAELKGHIFLQTRDKLNDPMDMYLTAKTTAYTSFIKAYKKHPTEYVKELSEKGFTDKEIKKVINLSPEKAYNFIRDRLAITFGKYGASKLDDFSYVSISEELDKINHLNSFNRIACFTETYINMPMWSSYANDYQGICIEYNVEKKDILQKIFPVIYTDNLPDIYDMFSKLEFRKELPIVSSKYLFLRLLFKNDDWGYEKEWRFIDNALYEVMDSTFDDFVENYLGKLPCDKKNEIEERLYNLSSYFQEQQSSEIFFLEMIKIFPTDFMEELSNFLLKLPPPNGKLLDDFKPCRIYLGHKIKPEYEKEFRKLAKDLNIEVLKMSLKPQGYQPISIEEADKEKYQVFLKKAESFLDNSQYDEAIQACNESIKILPNAETYIIRGLCYSRKEKLELALNDYKEAIKIDPIHPVGHSNAGGIYFKMRKYDLAIKEYLLFLSQWSNNANVYINLVIAYIYQNMYGDAIKTIKDALKQCTDFAKKLCGDSDFTESLKSNSLFIDSIHKEPTLSEISELIIGIKKNEE